MLSKIVNYKIFHLLFATILGLQFVPVVNAQGASERANPLEEVIVTAQRRAENAQHIPISLLVYDSKIVEEARLTDVQEVVALSPSVVLANQSSSNMHISIRGIGSNLWDAGSQQSVGLTVDDVFITRKGAFIQDMFDVERVEVLRGPQGTLYGKNVVGGVINIVNKKPTRENQAKFEAGAGDYGLFETKGMLNLPIGETTALRAVVSYRQRDGYVNNVWVPVDPALTNPDPFNNFAQCPDCTGDMDDVDSISGRISLRGEPNDQFSWDLSAYHHQLESNGIHTRLDNAISGLFVSQFQFQPEADFYSVNNGNTPGHLDLDFTLARLKLNYETSFGTWTSITAGQFLDYKENRDIANVAHQFGVAGGAGFRSELEADEDVSVFSQELWLSSVPDGPMTMNGRLNWVVGFYYSVEEIDRTAARQRRLTFSPTATISTSAPLFTQATTRKSIAAFTQLTYALTDKLNLTGGLRWTRDEIDLSTGVTNPLGSEPWITNLSPATELFGPTDSNESWSEPTGQVSIDYHLTDDVMIYGKYSRGFKSGGFQGDAGDEVAATLSYGPEFADNYEGGIKSQFLNDTLQINFNYFHMDFKDLQLHERRELVPGDPTTIVVVVFNAASAQIDGTELEMVWMPPVDGLTLSLSGGTLNTEVIDSVNPLYVGYDLQQAPEFSASFVGKYNRQLGDLGMMDIRLAYRYTGEFWWDLANLEPGLERAYGLLDGSISFTKNKWKVTLWGKNLTGEEYHSFGDSVTGTPGTNRGGINTSRIGDPRTWGVTVSYDFDW